MAPTHRIIELLTHGVSPTDSEVHDLEGVGRFASSMFGRYHGVLPSADGAMLGAKSIRWSDRIADNLSARTGERWTEGLGLSDALLSGGWLGTWGQRLGLREGYSFFDEERLAIQLEDELGLDEPRAPRGVRRRARSLFDAPRSSTRRAPARRRGEKNALAWRRGGNIAQDAVVALEAGGLFLDDQLAGEAPEAAALPSGERTLRPRPASLRGAQSAKPVSLDGLHIGRATPSLSGALAWAEGVFGEYASAAPLAVTSHNLSRMLGRDGFGLSGDVASARPAPVFGFFDSVEGEFVALKEALMPAEVPAGASRSEAGPAVSRLARPETRPSTRPALPGRPTSKALDGGEIATGLSRLVSPSALGSDSLHLRPYTGGVFPPRDHRGSGPPAGQNSHVSRSERPRFASQFVADRSGRLVARVQRGAMSAPRVATRGLSGGVSAEMAATSGGRTEHTLGDRLWLSASDRGPDLPLAASLSRHEAMAGALATKRAPLASPVTTFAPLISQPQDEHGVRRQRAMPRQRSDAALDGVVWLSMPVGSEDAAREGGSLSEGSRPLIAQRELRPLSVVPVSRQASMVPADVALAHSLGAAATLYRGQRLGSERGKMFAEGQAESVLTEADGRAFVQPASADAHWAPRPRGLQGTDAERFARSGLWIEPRQLIGRMSDDTHSPLGTGARQGPWVADSLESLSTDGGVLESAGLMGEALAARWMAGDGSEAAVESWSPRASRQLRTDLGRGVYASGQYGLDVTMVTPQLAEEEAETSALPSRRRRVPLEHHEQGVSAPQRPAISERMMARIAGDRDARSTRPADDRPPSSEGGALIQGVQPGDLAALISRSSLGQGGPSQAPNVSGRDALMLGSGISDRPASSVARGARTALRRPVSTSREVLAISSFINALREEGTPIAQFSGMGTTVEAAAELEAAQPHLLGHLRALRSGDMMRSWSSDVGDSAVRFAAHVASMNSGQAARVGQALRLAGWREPELRMLHLPGGLETQGTGATQGVGRLPAHESPAPEVGPMLAKQARNRADEASASPEKARTVAGIAEEDPTRATANTRHMARSLARILTETESLSSGVSGGAKGLAAESLLGARHSFVMSTQAEAYFADNAPSRGRRAWTSDLMDAVGELVALAESTTSTGTVADHEGRMAVMRRAQQLQGLWGPKAGEQLGRDVPEVLRRMMAAGASQPSRQPEMWATPLDDGVQLGSMAAGTQFTREPPIGIGADELSPGYGRFGQDERRMLDLTAAQGAEEEPRERAFGSSISRLASRVTNALAVAASGPAGADRLTRAAGRGEGAPLGSRHDDVSIVDAGELTLGAALAPEAMLPGMRSERLGRRPGRGRRHRLADRGLASDLTTVRGQQLTGAAEMPPTGPAEMPPTGPLRASQSARIRDIERQKTTRQIAATLRRAGVAEGKLGSGLLHGLVARLERTASGGSLRRGEIADFTMAWLDRVDGNRTGLDIGLDGVREDVVSAVGAWASSRRSSRLAATSPITEASKVGLPATDRGAGDRSGLRRASRESLSTSSSASRPRHRAATALRQADWKFVDTGSRESTPHADLGQLAAKIMEIAPAAGEAPMPLVAPAVKAVAQTALRKGRGESMGGDAATAGGDAAPSAAGGESGAASEAGKLSKAAFEKLAYEMADRVARRLKREQERKGQWP